VCAQKDGDLSHVKGLESTPLAVAVVSPFVQETKTKFPLQVTQVLVALRKQSLRAKVKTETASSTELDMDKVIKRLGKMSGTVVSLASISPCVPVPVLCEQCDVIKLARSQVFNCYPPFPS